MPTDRTPPFEPAMIHPRSPSFSHRHSRRILRLTHLRTLLFCFSLFLCPAAIGQDLERVIPPKPPDVSSAWKKLIGEYGPDTDVHYVLERAGKLIFLRKNGGEWPLRERGNGAFELDLADSRIVRVAFESAASHHVAALRFGAQTLVRRKIGPEEGHVFRIAPARPVEELRREALAASPPVESGEKRKPDLVELTSLDPSIHLDIRYATSNDFLGTPVYTQARAFLQRPAAEALVRAHRALRSLGYGLLIHDGYRPWFVTKIFWDATPPEGKVFVADPSQGSRHNRGCAVDLTLYASNTGKSVEMPGAYDEMSPRSFPIYPGGTSLQRWRRDLLRRAMEAQGFAVYEAEWWHFDYQDWPQYADLNIPFEKLPGGKPW